MLWQGSKRRTKDKILVSSFSRNDVEGGGDKQHVCSSSTFNNFSDKLDNGSENFLLMNSRPRDEKRLIVFPYRVKLLRLYNCASCWLARTVIIVNL